MTLQQRPRQIDLNMYDYNREVVVKLKKMLRNVGLKYPASKAQMVTGLQKWDKENAPRIAAYEPDVPKKTASARKKAPPVHPLASRTTPVEPNAPLPKRKMQLNMKRKEPSDPAEDDLTPRRQKIAQPTSVLPALSSRTEFQHEVATSDVEDEVAGDLDAQTSLEGSSSDKDEQEDHGEQNAKMEAQYVHKLRFNLKTGQARGIMEERSKQRPLRSRTKGKPYAGVQKPVKVKSQRKVREMLDQVLSRLGPNAIAPEDDDEEGQSGSKLSKEKGRAVRTVVPRIHHAE